MLTYSELEQIRQYLASYGKKDSQLPNVDSVNDVDYIAIIQNGVNKTASVKQFETSFIDTFLNDTTTYGNSIDDVPTQNSTVFVRSGGVWSAINGAGVIGNNQLASNAVSTAKILDASVTREKLDPEIETIIHNAESVTDGESAYEIAVDYGYIGTEEEWLASLKGDQGDPGPRGGFYYPTIVFDPTTGELIVQDEDLEGRVFFDYSTGELIIEY